MVDLNYITLPDNFLEPETRLDFHIDRTRKEVWAIELDMLQLIKNICEENNIKWWVHAGTLLGAVRDEHIIPWDDDIDVVMIREDYEKFIHTCNKYIKEPYFIQNYLTDENTFNKFSKLRRLDTDMRSGFDNKIQFIKGTENIHGIFLDIFPLDLIPNDEDESKKFIEELVLIRRSNMKINPETVEAFNKLSIKYNNDETALYYMETGLIHNRIEQRYKRMLYKKEYFNTTDYKYIEFIKVPVPGSYELLLSDKYGEDWRIPQQLNSFHNIQSYDTNNSYRIYQTDFCPTTVIDDKEIVDKYIDIMSMLLYRKFYTGEKHVDYVTFSATTDKMIDWISERIPEIYRKHISFLYVGKGNYSYCVFDNSDQKLLESDKELPLEKSKLNAINLCLDLILDQMKSL